MVPSNRTQPDKGSVNKRKKVLQDTHPRNPRNPWNHKGGGSRALDLPTCQSTQEPSAIMIHNCRSCESLHCYAHSHIATWSPPSPPMQLNS